MRLSCHCFLALACAVFTEASSPKLPPPDNGATDLKFEELLVTPVGDRGPALTDKAKSLDQKHVRIVGYMVRQEATVAGRILLTPVPVQLHDEHYGLADDLPATTIFISTADSKNIQYKPGLFIASGVFSVGNREEADGRISTFRIALDAQPKKSGLFRNVFQLSKRPHASHTEEKGPQR